VKRTREKFGCNVRSSFLYRLARMCVLSGTSLRMYNVATCLQPCSLCSWAWEVRYVATLLCLVMVCCCYWCMLEPASDRHSAFHEWEQVSLDWIDCNRSCFQPGKVYTVGTECGLFSWWRKSNLQLPLLLVHVARSGVTS